MLRAMLACPPLRPLRVASALVLAGCLGAGTAHAGPNVEKSDPLGQLLADKSFFSALPAVQLPSAAATAELAGRVRDRASDMVVTAMSFLGVPYKRGGSSETAGFDCSGFTRHIFEVTLGRVLPRRADEQASAPGLTPVDKSELKPGDLVFFNTLKRTFSHVGIYIGEGKFIHAPRPGGEVRVEQMSLDYWRKRFTGARRVDAAAAPAAGSASAPAAESLIAAP
jgi:cell wall-associated NlpC family hydrolase